MGWKLRPRSEVWVPSLISGVGYLILAALLIVALVVKLIAAFRRAFRHRSRSSSGVIEICPIHHVASAADGQFKVLQEGAVSSCSAASPTIANVVCEAQQTHDPSDCRTFDVSVDGGSPKQAATSITAEAIIGSTSPVGRMRD